MALLTKQRPVISHDPRILVLYGPPKVGKTTVLSQLDSCYVLDTEEGSNMLSGYYHGINSLAELKEFIESAQADPEFSTRHKYLALDTIDKLEDWIVKALCEKYGATHLGDIEGFGAGYAYLRENMMAYIQTLKSLTPHLILIGHRKLAAIHNKEGVDIVSPESLDLIGKVKTQISSDADAIGYMMRDAETEELIVSFKSGQALEAGTRCEHIKGQILPFNWNSIYIERN